MPSTIILSLTKKGDGTGGLSKVWSDTKGSTDATRYAHNRELRLFFIWLSRVHRHPRFGVLDAPATSRISNRHCPLTFTQEPCR